MTHNFVRTHPIFSNKIALNKELKYLSEVSQDPFLYKECN